MKKPLPTYMPRCFTRKLISVKSLQKRVMALLSMEISSSVHLGEWDTWTGWGGRRHGLGSIYHHQYGRVYRWM